MPVSPARSAAFDILLQVEREDSYASELLHASRYGYLSEEDHGLATELVMGALRWRSRLDQRIAACSTQPLERLDVEVLTALRLAAYQVAFLERVPARAAVHESVELVKRARKRSAGPFVNAVLRKFVEINPRFSATSNSEVLAESYAHPRWLVERWVENLGRTAAEKVCRFDQSIPEIAIRLRGASVEADLSAEGIRLSPGTLLRSARRVDSGQITKTRACTEGRVVVQDEASQLVALLLGRGIRILDCCAAPGGKTRVLADRNPEATITAVELYPHRARLLQKLIHAANVKVILADIRKLPVQEPFDRVLADVPCSGTGTLARHPEIKWRLKPEDLSDLQSRQIAILESALQHLAPGGRLVYSTCSLEPEENSQVVETVLADSSLRRIDCREELQRLRAENELVSDHLDSLVSGPYLRTIPGVHPCDGFFAAILQKS